MRRLALIALASSLSIPVVAFVHGCEPRAPSIQDFCGFLANEDNCYLTLLKDVGPRCGVPGSAEAGIASSEWGAPKGYFVERAMLDKCVLEDGGQIAFDTALDLTTFPPKGVSFSVKDATGAVCGTFVFQGQHNYTISVSPVGPNNTILPERGPECTAPEAGVDDIAGTDDLGGATICGGTFVSSAAEGDFVDTTCGTEEHHFISTQLDVPGCERQKQLLPRYEIDASPGGIDAPGFIRLRVFYPKPDQAADASTIVQDAVAYFDCAIPPEPRGCCNGQKDGTETDIDCGGAMLGEGTCDRCQDGQGCVSSADCNGGTCAVDMNGIKKCSNATPLTASVCDPPDAGAGGSGSASSSAGAGGSGGAGGTGGAGGAGGN